MTIAHGGENNRDAIDVYVGRVDLAGRNQLVRRLGPVAKRAVDLVGAVGLIVILAPLMIAVAIAIKIDTRGPVLFRQDRVGARRSDQGGHEVWTQTSFLINKFRTMKVDADEGSHIEYTRRFVEGSAAESNKAGSEYKLIDDQRVTRVGAVLRRTSLDELPQLFNVVAGEMSLVGPRPVPVYEAALYKPWQKERLHALPGITGYWQVHGRGAVPFEEMMRMDIYYVRNRSLWMDLKLLAMTIPAVISGRGAE